MKLKNYKRSKCPETKKLDTKLSRFISDNPLPSFTSQETIVSFKWFSYHQLTFLSNPHTNRAVAW